jgi:hypothetical protein
MAVRLRLKVHGVHGTSASQSRGKRKAHQKKRRDPKAPPRF